MNKLKRIRRHYRIMIRLYPWMDKRKARRDAYFYYSKKAIDIRFVLSKFVKNN